MRERSRHPSLSERAFARVIHVFPSAFRERFGAEMSVLFRDQLAAARARGGRGQVARLWARTLPSLCAAALLEHRDGLIDRRPVTDPGTRRDGMMQALATDLRFAGRMLRKSPVFTVVAVFVISLGTGAVTTIFSAIEGLLLRPIPGTHAPERLVGFQLLQQDGVFTMTASPEYLDFLRQRAHLLEGLAGYTSAPFTVSADGEGAISAGGIVSGNFFPVLGVRPALGRFFLPEEDSVSAGHSALVISHAMWTSRFLADPGVLGRSVLVNGQAATIVGVAPQGFVGAMSIMPEDVWVTQAAARLLLRNRRSYLRPVGRLREGVRSEAAERELTALAAERAAAPEALPEGRAWTVIRLAPMRAIPADARGDFLGFLSLLLGAAGLVLLIASVNVASMLSARAISRHREMALRTALGAGRLRLVRQLLTETVLLFSFGAVGGALITVGATTALEQLRVPIDVSLVLEISPNATVFIVALAVSLATGVLFGLSPALNASRKEITTRLRDESAGSGTRRSLMGNTLIVGQLAASLVLLVSAGLFMRALDRGQRLDKGFDATGVATMSLAPEIWGYDEQKARTFMRSLRTHVEALPGVTAVSFTAALPLTASGSGGRIRIDGRDEGPAIDGQPSGLPISLMYVDADYFSLLRMPLRGGRPVQAVDADGAPRVAVLNETLANRYWPVGSALGRTFQFRDRQVTVVGVVRDSRYQSLGEDIPPVAYLPIAQWWQGGQVLLARTEAPPATFRRALQDAVASMDPGLPRPEVNTLERATSVVLIPQRIAANVTAVLGGVGLLLATVGLYGLVSYSAARRTREIGVRMALGAERADVLRLIVRDGLRLTAMGVASGLLLAVVVTRLLSRFLFSVDPLDAVTFVAMSLLFAGVAFVASYLPARRAALANPLTALRSE